MKQINKPCADKGRIYER